MRTIFIEARYSFGSKAKAIKLPPELIEALPDSVAIFASVQFIGFLSGIKKQLAVFGKKARLYKPRHSLYCGQLLGCGIARFSADAFLYIGDGKFHAIALSIRNNKPVFCFDPFSGNFFVIGEKEHSSFKKRIMAGISSVVSSKNIAILATTKPGQCRVKDALALKKKLEKKGKNAFVFLSNDIALDKLQDFSFIDCYINTACPRIAYDDYKSSPKPIINIDDVYSEIKGWLEE